MPIIDIGSATYTKPLPRHALVSDLSTTVTSEDRLIIGEPYLLTDSSKLHDDEESQLDQFSCLVLDKDALVSFCGRDILDLWDEAAGLVNMVPEQLPGINTDHLFVKHLGIILQDGGEPCIAVEEEDNTPTRVAFQQSILEVYGKLMARILLGVGKKLFKTHGYEDVATGIDYMAHVLKRRHFPCFGTEENAWFNNLTLLTSTQIMDVTRDRANFNGAVPLPLLFVRGSGRVYVSRFAKVFEAEPYSVVLVGSAEQVVVGDSPPGEERRTMAFGRCEEDVFRHYAQYDPMNQMRDRLAKEMQPQ